mmetsp:Transcript_7619/g.19450  ORF Transcript_7619/g.19450 Transcript_7619/m.19450 type:complete len:255 (-) Transcript_7619:115-879(-)
MAVGCPPVRVGVEDAIADAVAARDVGRLVGNLREPHGDGPFVPREVHGHALVVEAVADARAAGDLALGTELQAVAVGEGPVHAAPVDPVAHGVAARDHRRLPRQQGEAHGLRVAVLREHDREALAVHAVADARPSGNVALRGKPKLVAVGVLPGRAAVEDLLAESIASGNRRRLPGQLQGPHGCAASSALELHYDGAAAGLPDNFPLGTEGKWLRRATTADAAAPAASRGTRPAGPTVVDMVTLDETTCHCRRR